MSTDKDGTTPVAGVAKSSLEIDATDVITGEVTTVPSGAAEIATKQASNQEPSRMQTLAGVAGNVLEWFDFAVYGYFADVISANFFPPQSGNAALLESFVVFGGAFLVRPGACV